jgi:hypothetical protein
MFWSTNHRTYVQDARTVWAGKLGTLDRNAFLLYERSRRAYRIPFDQARSISLTDRTIGGLDGLWIGAIPGAVGGAMLGLAAVAVGLARTSERIALECGTRTRWRESSVDSRQLAMTAADKAVAMTARNCVAVAPHTTFMKHLLLAVVRALAAATGAPLCAADTEDRAGHRDP